MPSHIPSHVPGQLIPLDPAPSCPVRHVQPRTCPAARAVPRPSAPFPCPAPACPSSRPRPPLRGAPLPALPAAPRLGTAALRRPGGQRTPGKQPRGAVPGGARAFPPVLTVCPAGSAALAPAARPRRHHGMRAPRLRRRWPGAGGRAGAPTTARVDPRLPDTRGRQSCAGGRPRRGAVVAPEGVGDMSGHFLSLTDTRTPPATPGHRLSPSGTALSPVSWALSVPPGQCHPQALFVTPVLHPCHQTVSRSPRGSPFPSWIIVEFPTLPFHPTIFGVTECA